MEPVPPLVTLHVWGVPRAAVPRALARVATDRRRLSRTPGLRFAKSLGTGDGRTFTVRDADPRRWALLCAWRSDADARVFDASPVPRAWARIAEETCRLDLRPLLARGRWSGRTPFGSPVPHRHDGPVVALTRARLAARTAATFWRAVPPVSAALDGAPGLRLALGVGEAPIGLQGTVSVWDDAAALRAFAYGSAEHRRAVERTAQVGWYAEEMFARFALVASVGSVGGVSPAGGPPRVATP